MTLTELPQRIPEYSALKEIDIIKLIIWWAQTYCQRENVTGEYLRQCYGTLGRATPDGGFSAYFKSLEERKPKHLIRSRDGYKLEHRIRDDLSKKYGQRDARDATIHIEKILAELPAKLANPAERTYLEETLICIRHKAFRAAVVMAWNLAYDHFCYWILADTVRLASFNATSPKRLPGMKYPPITNRDGFTEMKESHVIAIASSSNVITKNVARVLDEKLTRRNMAAHPSDVSTLQPTAEEVIRDLVENVVLRLQ
jgi:hypothetical protein